ncbi:hypothetical protein E2C01_096113 [Portunus trituberculatus]|uniref:Uncharacterized protein n=1 Tax=Portunus trituberculatus TaxID=210409 RepID=A0A5B7K5S3_PORTR|nr:hypothetical protein [Portunus trituberculatus]
MSKSKDDLVEYSAKYCVDVSSSETDKDAPEKNSVSFLHNMAEEEAISLSQESYLASLSLLPMKYSHHP